MRRLLSISVLFILLGGSISLSLAVVDRVVAVVNQEIITLSEVEKLIAPLKQEIRAANPLEKRERIQEVSRQALDRLIEERLIDQEAKRSGVKVTSKEVDEALEEVRKRNNATQEELDRALAKEGVTIEAFKKQIEKNILRMKLINANVKPETKAGEKELRNFYQANIEQYQANFMYRPSHILFTVPKGATPEEVREIRKKCEQVLEKIKKGEDFGEMALLYSQDISSKDRGDLGYFKRGELLPSFEKEALRLQIGEVSRVVRTEFGFHLIKLLDRKGGEPRPFEEVRDKVQVDYSTMAVEKALKQYLSTLREKAVIEIKL